MGTIWIFLKNGNIKIQFARLAWTPEILLARILENFMKHALKTLIFTAEIDTTL